jgi:hypothetical protein
LTIFLGKLIFKVFPAVDGRKEKKRKEKKRKEKENLLSCWRRFHSFKIKDKISVWLLGRFNSQMTSLMSASKMK